MSSGSGGQDPPRNPGPYPSKKVKLKKGDTKKTTPAANIEEFNPEVVFTFRGGITSHFQKEWALRSGWPASGSSDGSDSEASYGSLPANCSNANEVVPSQVPAASSLGVNDAKNTTSNMEIEAGGGPTIPRRYPHSNLGPEIKMAPTAELGTQTGRGPTIPREGILRPNFSPASRTWRFSSAIQTRHRPSTIGETRKGWGHSAP